MFERALDKLNERGKPDWEREKPDWMRDREGIEQRAGYETRFFDPHQEQVITGSYRGQEQVGGEQFAHLQGQKTGYLVPDQAGQFQQFEKGQPLEVGQGHVAQKQASREQGTPRMALKPSPELRAKMQQWERQAWGKTAVQEANQKQGRGKEAEKTALAQAHTKKQEPGKKTMKKAVGGRCL